MRVLHVVRSDGFSGVERHIGTLAAAQVEAGHEVTVIGGAQAEMVSLEASGVRTMAGDTLTEALRSVRRTTRPDVVHAHMTAGELAAAVGSSAPLVVTRHFARRRGATMSGKAGAALVRRRLRGQIAISRYVADAVDGEATVVYPGVQGHDRPDPEGRRPVVLVVQRLQPEKNTDVALRAFTAGAPADWTLEVVGRGPQQAALQRLARQLGVEKRVSFLGFRDDVPTLMRSASILIAPCEVEGLGLSVLESMSHGLAVVASRAGAHPETVGLATAARLFEPGNSAAAAEQLAGLCADEGGRRAYGDDLWHIQRTTFTPRAQASATLAIYEQVIS